MTSSKCVCRPMHDLRIGAPSLLVLYEPERGALRRRGRNRSDGWSRDRRQLAHRPGAVALPHSTRTPCQLVVIDALHRAEQRRDQVELRSQTGDSAATRRAAFHAAASSSPNSRSAEERWMTTSLTCDVEWNLVVADSRWDRGGRGGVCARRGALQRRRSLSMVERQD
jgi:hypothetical protein